MSSGRKISSIVWGSPTSVVQESVPQTIPALPETIGGNDATEQGWVCPASAKSQRTTNPIRAIVDPIVANSTRQAGERADGKELISLALGDPTASDSLPVCQVAIDAVQRALALSPRSTAGYVNACGTPDARAAVAKFHSYPGSEVTADNVIVASGCSGALELALTALLDPGTVLLVPKPGFPLYQVIAESHGAVVVHYDLLSQNNWECSLGHLEQLVRQFPPSVIRGIVVNNPSNPTGAVYRECHLEDVVRWAQRNRVPIVADEIYGDLTFGSNTFHPLAKVAAKLGGNAPVITASGIGKQYLLPGWRVGWIVFHDSHGQALRQVEAGAKRLAQVVLGASHLAQMVVPALLSPETKSDQQALAKWKLILRTTLERQATALCVALSKCHGLTVQMPQGAMYAMIQLDLSQFDSLIQDDLVFTKLLLQEENVFVLPGRAFGAHAPAVFRVVYCASERLLMEAAARIANFCQRHASSA